MRPFLRTVFGIVLACGVGCCACSKAETADHTAESASSAVQVRVEEAVPDGAEAEKTDGEDVVLTEDADPDMRVETMLEAMSIEQKVAQMLMVSFRYWGEGEARQPVTRLNDAIADAIGEIRPGGVILFSQNLPDAGTAAALTAAMQQANADGGAESALLIATDQEGGIVTRLSTGTQMPGNMALAASGNPELAFRAAAVIGRELSSAGIHADFAPVMDVNGNPSNPVIGLRSFSDDPSLVGRFGQSFMEGLGSAGVMRALKHFPGHGDTDTDSHTGLPLIDKSPEELRNSDLIPFAETVREADLVMTAHILYPQIEQNTCLSKSTGNAITLPATLSETILTGILRKELGFRGVIVTDAMDMDAIAQHFDRKDAARYAINAGADLILMPVMPETEGGLAELRTYIHEIVSMVNAGEIAVERVDESVRRILTLKAEYGLLDATAYASQKTDAAFGTEEHHETEWEITLETITLLKNENGLLPLGADNRVLLVYPSASQENAVTFAMNRLLADGVIASADITEALCYESLSARDADALADRADTVIAVSALYGARELNPEIKDGAAGAFLDALLQAVHARGGRFVQISAQLPYDVARFPDADAVLACYNAGGMPELPEAGKETAQYGPNLPAAIYTVFGGHVPQGTLPVDIPAIDSAYRYTEEILYHRGDGLSGF